MRCVDKFHNRNKIYQADSITGALSTKPLTCLPAFMRAHCCAVKSKKLDDAADYLSENVYTRETYFIGCC